tara:strand:+ start:12033 stop:13430 length:1398 start_codon:yes stop_codon:yes gene_type:complete
MFGGTVESKGVLELTGDAGIYIMSNIVRLFSNMAAASVGYKPINNNLGVPGSGVDDSLMQDFKKVLSMAKVPIGIVTGVMAQYLNVLNMGMRVNAPMLQASLLVTIKIIQTQLSLANATLQNKAFLGVLKSTLDSLQLVSDEIVSIVDPVATDILEKLSPIINNSIGKIFQTIGTSALSGAQSIPYAGTALAALSSLDAITKMWVASINASTATASLFIDGYSNTVKGVSGAISKATGRMNSSAESFKNPVAAAASKVPKIQKGGMIQEVEAEETLGYVDMGDNEFYHRKGILMYFLTGRMVNMEITEYRDHDMELIRELPDNMRDFLRDPRITEVVDRYPIDTSGEIRIMKMLNALRNVVLLWLTLKLPRLSVMERAEYIMEVTLPIRTRIESRYSVIIGNENNTSGRRFVVVSNFPAPLTAINEDTISARVGGGLSKEKPPLRIATFNDIRGSIVPNPRGNIQ